MIKTNKKNLHHLWEILGIKTGQLVMCHSFLGGLGKLDGGPQIVIETLLDKVGTEGTIIVPTFTYSYFNSELYDVNNSPSKVGVLGDSVRSLPNAIRSLDPVFSMAAIGRNSSNLMKRHTKNSFGNGSIYQNLCENDLHILLLGCDFTSLSLFMHLEKINNVNYRFDKIFKGRSRKDTDDWKDEVIHFVRKTDMGFETDRNKIGKIIEIDKMCKLAKYGYGVHRYISAKSVADIVKVQLTQDPNILIKLNKK